MTLEEAKRVAADPLGHAPHEVMQAARVLAAALGEPTPEDRDAAEWCRDMARITRETSRVKDFDERDAKRLDRAADALERSPADTTAQRVAVMLERKRMLQVLAEELASAERSADEYERERQVDVARQYDAKAGLLHRLIVGLSKITDGSDA